MTIIAGRCGTCALFPGNAAKCPSDTCGRSTVYANDHGQGDCTNYKEAQPCK